MKLQIYNLVVMNFIIYTQAVPAKKSKNEKCEISSKLTLKIPERRHFEQISVFALVSLLFEQVSHLV